MNSSRPFRGSAARQSGDVTRGQLRGPTFRSLGPDIYAAAGVPVDLALRARAAALSVPSSVVGGYAAAELLEASCGPEDALVDLIVGRRRVRPRCGVRVHQVVLTDEEVTTLDDVTVTSPRRTAWDLARALDADDAVVAVDALARLGKFAPNELLVYPAARDNPRGTSSLQEVVGRADPRAESPMETRARLLLIEHGFPAPQLQVWVHDERGDRVGRIDLAWPALKIGLEYQGDDHRVDRRRYARDNVRAGDLATLGWLILPLTSFDVLVRPDVLVERVDRAFAARGLVVTSPDAT